MLLNSYYPKTGVFEENQVATLMLRPSAHLDDLNKTPSTCGSEVWEKCGN